MYCLSEEKVDWILNDLQNQGLTHQRLQGELLDHICCAIEETMWDHHIEFDQAYQQTLNAFGEEGILKIQKATVQATRRRHMNQRITRFSTMLAACLILFIGMVVQAKERPDALPLNTKLPVVVNFDKNIVIAKDYIHQGVNLQLPISTKVFATASGTVIKAAYNQQKGYYIVIKHHGSYTTTYAHLSKLLVKKGDEIQQRKQIALSGNSGKSTAPHLHYLVQKNGKLVDSEKYFSK